MFQWDNHIRRTTSASSWRHRLRGCHGYLPMTRDTNSTTLSGKWPLQTASLWNQRSYSPYWRSFNPLRANLSLLFSQLSLLSVWASAVDEATLSCHFPD